MGWFQFPQVQLTWFAFLKNLVASVVKLSSYFSVCNDIELLTHFQDAARCPSRFENVRYGLKLCSENSQSLLLQKGNISIIQMQIGLTLFKKKYYAMSSKLPRELL